MYGTALCTMALGLSSCDNDEFLNVTQYESYSKDAMYETDDNAVRGLTGVYDLLFPEDAYDGDWGFKPNLFTGCHPTMDTQATGWDADWMSQNWNANSAELLTGWKHVYAAICRANDFLAGLDNSTTVSADTKKYCAAEAKAIRAFFYHWLATSFGRVPMLESGENFINTPQKARAKTYVEMWDFIIKDLEDAAANLDWKPWKGQYGRATKGMALAYLGDAYMWKAYRLTDGANGMQQDEAQAKELYKKAADSFKQILDSKTYKLNESFTTLWDPASAWGPEAIWVEQLDEGNNWGQWGNITSKLMLKWYTACNQGNGGWGSLFLSWEWYSMYEQGDKRRVGSCYTANVPQICPDSTSYDPQYAGWYEKDIYGVNPYLQEQIGKDHTVNTFHQGGEPGPMIWSSKMWRTASADYKGWGDGHWSPTPIYWKRLPNVMLDYAECLFRTEGEGSAEAWAQLDELRERASGQLETDVQALTAKYLPYYNSYAAWVADARKTDDPDPKKNDPNLVKLQLDRKEYPIAFGPREKLESAQTYYAKYAAEKGFKSEVWKVAVNTERRKEFNCEWSLRPDMQRSGFMADHIDVNYPKMQYKDENDQKNNPWTQRVFDYSELKMDMPIPNDEILKNPMCDQNPAYVGKE